jgi:hypothetical protein
MGRKISSLRRSVAVLFGVGLCGWATAGVMPAPAFAGDADVVDAQVTRQSDGTYSFAVSVRHDDTGWDHYADAWQVVGPDGTVLATRVLLHPHETEQPFTRSLSGVAIPDGVRTVTLRAHDKVHGYGGITVEIALPDR